MKHLSSIPVRRVVELAPLTAALGGLGVLIWAFFRYAVDVPVFDQWSVIYLFDHYYKGTLTFNDFFTPHNEHRLLFPKLLMLLLGLLSDYNVLWEMAAGMVMALCTLALLWLHLGTRFEMLRLGAGRFVLCCGLALGILTLRQHENWFWGFQVQWFMNVLAVCGGLTFLCRRDLDWGAMIGAALCGVWAMFSLSAGLLYWPLVLVCLPLLPRKGDRPLRPFAVLWCVLSLCLFAAYFTGLHSTTTFETLRGNMADPVLYAHYVLIYLATPFLLWGQTGWPGVILGLACLALLLLETRRVLRLPRRERQAALFFLFLGYYALGTALVTGAGRIQLGLTRATSSRYVTIAILAWFPALQYLCVVREKRWRKNTALALAVALLCLMLLRSWQSLPYINYANSVTQQGRWALRHAPHHQALQEICWSPEDVRKRAIPLFKRHNLSVFRK